MDQVRRQTELFRSKSHVLCLVEFRKKIINHFLLVQNTAMNAVLYNEQLDDHFYLALAGRRYPALINQKHRVLQHDNAPEAHTVATHQSKNQRAALVN